MYFNIKLVKCLTDEAVFFVNIYTEIKFISLLLLLWVVCTAIKMVANFIIVIRTLDLAYIPDIFLSSDNVSTTCKVRGVLPEYSISILYSSGVILRDIMYISEH